VSLLPVDIKTNIDAIVLFAKLQASIHENSKLSPLGIPWYIIVVNAGKKQTPKLSNMKKETTEEILMALTDEHCHGGH